MSVTVSSSQMDWLLRTPLKRQARWCRTKTFKIWPTEIDAFDRVAPFKFEGDEKAELHDIMKWMDPTIEARKSGTKSTEPLYKVPEAIKPSSLTYGDIGEMYRLSDEDMRAFFQEGFAGMIVKAFAPPLQPRCFLYRKQAHLLNKYIEKFQNWSDKAEVLREMRDGKPGFIFDGPHGCGKSVIINQAVHFARSRDMLTFYIPDATDWTSASFVVPSTTLPGFFDNPNETLQFLKFFCRMDCNKKILRERKLTRKYPIPKVTDFDKMDTLWDLLNYGFDDIETTVVVFKYFLDELIEIKDIPIVFVIDNYDAFCKKTEYFHMHEDVLRETPVEGFDIKVLPKKPIHSSRLTLVRALNFMLLSNQPNRLFITSTCRQVGQRSQSEFDLAPFDPLEDTLLHPMEVPPAYTDYEARTILRCYLELMEGTDAEGVPLDSGWSWRRLELPSFERMLYKIKFITNNNPYLVWHQSEMKQFWRAEYHRHRQTLARKRSEVLSSLSKFGSRS